MNLNLCPRCAEVLPTDEVSGGGAVAIELHLLRHVLEDIAVYVKPKIPRGPG